MESFMELDKTKYKYMHYEDARALVSNGSFRIGTLYDYKKIESHGGEIGDEVEGRKVIHCQQKHIVKGFNEPRDFDKYFPVFSQDGDGDGDLVISDIHFVNDQSSPNIFVCSFSNSFDIDAMNKMGYDTCVKILDLDKFLINYFKKIVKKGLATGGYSSCKKMIYTDDKEMDINDAHDRPAWEMKDIRYKYQDEYRFVFEATNPETIEPIILKSHIARKQCSIIYKPK